MRIASHGLNMPIPFVDMIRGYVNVRLTPLDVEVETKTQYGVLINNPHIPTSPPKKKNL